MIDNQHKSIITLLCLSNAAISFSTGAVAASIPSIAHDFALSELEVAKIVSYYMIPYGIGALIYAPLSRFINYRMIFIAAMLFYAGFNFVSAISHSFTTLLFAQIGAGIAAASNTPMSLMTIGELFEKNIRGRMVGLFFGTSFFSSILGMICMGLVSWPWLFFIPAALAMVSVIGFILLKSKLLDKVHQESINYFSVLKKLSVLKIFIFIFIMSFFYHGLHKWYGVYLSSEYGLSKEWVSGFLIVAALFGLSGQQIGGYLSDKKGRMVSCYAGIFILAFGAICLYGHYPLIIVPLILGAIAMGWTVHHNSMSTILTDFPDDDRPMISSLNSSVRFFSGGLGFTVSRIFVEKSFSLTFLGIGCLMLSMSFLIKYMVTDHLN